ncbi:MAG TPA: hypothetical protein VG326_14265 [Tepidisphaeraceae bacterium]|jgi:hypothetical protein|nr:hypothetical protein [Tepidisphaeraceae bacterium]
MGVPTAAEEAQNAIEAAREAQFEENLRQKLDSAIKAEDAARAAADAALAPSPQDPSPVPSDDIPSVLDDDDFDLGINLYRRGTFADPARGWDGNFVKGSDWATVNPLLTPNYEQDYGLPAGNSGSPNWIAGGTINPNPNCVGFGPAAPSGSNPGGADEFNLAPTDLTLNWFHMP